MKTLELDISDKLRSRRKQLGLSMQEVANQTGLSVGFISQIERGITQPSLTSLATVGNALGMPLSELVQVSAPPQYGISRVRDRDEYHLKGSDAAYFMLSAGDSRLGMNSLITELPAGFKFVGREKHEGEELFYVLSGAVTLILGGAEHNLEEGDFAHYSSVIPHNVRNPHDKPARLLWVATMRLFENVDAKPIE